MSEPACLILLQSDYTRQPPYPADLICHSLMLESSREQAEAELACRKALVKGSQTEKKAPPIGVTKLPCGLQDIALAVISQQLQRGPGPGD